MLDIPMVLDMRITGRRTGKTLVYIIKLLFADDEPLISRDIIASADDWSANNRHKASGQISHYTRWFRNELIRIYDVLIMAELSPRQIFTRDESKHNQERDIWPPSSFKPEYYSKRER